MKKIVITLLLGSFCITMPPVLKRNTSNVCWNNAALQLLHNIKPITEALIEDKQKKLGKYYGKGDNLADAYIDFLEATFGNDQKAIDDAQEKLYSLTCKRMGINSGNQADPLETIKAIYTSFVKLFEHYTEFTLSYDIINNVKGRTTKIVFYTTTAKWEFDRLCSALEKHDKPALKKLPEYILMERTCNDPWNLIIQYYELIALIDAWAVPYTKNSTLPGGHFWTYIKDEFDSKHLWYMRDDMQTSLVNHLTSLPTLTCPAYALYKKIPGAVENFIANDGIETLANAFLGVKAI